jgi:hypothetical protein
MSTDPKSRSSPDDWPRYTVKCTLGAEAAGIDGTFADDEMVLFDPTRKGTGHWLSAAEGSFVRVDESL